MCFCESAYNNLYSCMRITSPFLILQTSEWLSCFFIPDWNCAGLSQEAVISSPSQFSTQTYMSFIPASNNSFWWQKMYCMYQRHCMLCESSTNVIWTVTRDWTVTAQLLVQALFMLHCNFLLAWLQAWTVKPLQMVQNGAAHLLFNQPSTARFTWLFITLAQFRLLTLAHKVATSTAPTYLNSLIQVHFSLSNWTMISLIIILWQEIEILDLYGHSVLARVTKLT